jgi:hypothetical protein
MDRTASIAAATDRSPRAMGMTKAAIKNAKRDERRARKRAEKASTVSTVSEEPFTPPRTTPVGSPVAPGAPMRPRLRRASGVRNQEFEALRAALRDAIGSYNHLRAACAACPTCSATVQDIEADPRAGEAAGTADDLVMVSAFEPFYF